MQPCEESLKNILIVNVLTSTAIIVTGSVINYIIWKRNAGLKQCFVIFEFVSLFFSYNSTNQSCIVQTTIFKRCVVWGTSGIYMIKY